jgi:hypothetical protein
MEITIPTQYIVVKPEQKINLDISSITDVKIIDSFSDKEIIAKIPELPLSVYLWKGDDEYTSAGNWTNETASAKLVEVLSLSSIPWVKNI